MSSELTCLLFGIPVLSFWLIGIKKGVMLGHHGRLVRRSDDALQYWIVTLFYGSIAVGLVVMPVFTWVGRRS